MSTCKIHHADIWFIVLPSAVKCGDNCSSVVRISPSRDPNMANTIWLDNVGEGEIQCSHIVQWCPTELRLGLKVLLAPPFTSLRLYNIHNTKYMFTVI